MRRNLAAYSTFQVFLNYPFDDAFLRLADALSFAVVAGGLLPVCAYDLTAPDRCSISSRNSRKGLREFEAAVMTVVPLMRRPEK